MKILKLKSPRNKLKNSLETHNNNFELIETRISALTNKLIDIMLPK